MRLDDSRRAPLHDHSTHFVFRCSDLDKEYPRVNTWDMWEVKANVVQISSQRGEKQLYWLLNNSQFTASPALLLCITVSLCLLCDFRVYALTRASLSLLFPTHDGLGVYSMKVKDESSKS